MKGFTSLPRWIVWGIALPLVVLNGWVLLLLLNYFEAIAIQFITAMLLAFILNYPVTSLQQFKLPRTLAIFVVLGLATLLFVLLGITLVPTLVEQVNDLANRLPNLVDSGTAQIQAFQVWTETRNLPIDLSSLVPQLKERLSTQLQFVSGQLLNIVLDTISSAFDLILTIILTFYLLLHGRQLWSGIFQWFPTKIGGEIRQIVQQKFHNYFVGQSILALIMGTAMTIAFLVMQVPYGLLFGIVLGFLALIPFGAPLGITIVTILTALKSVWLGLRVLVIASIIEQLVESGLAPQLIGGFIGLNPVWILVSLLIGAKIAGVLGVIIAVPIASSIKSIANSLKSSQTEEAEPQRELLSSNL